MRLSSEPGADFHVFTSGPWTCCWFQGLWRNSHRREAPGFGANTAIWLFRGYAGPLTSAWLMDLSSVDVARLTRTLFGGLSSPLLARAFTEVPLGIYSFNMLQLRKWSLKLGCLFGGSLSDHRRKPQAVSSLDDLGSCGGAEPSSQDVEMTSRLSHIGPCCVCMAPIFCYSSEV